MPVENTPAANAEPTPPVNHEDAFSQALAQSQNPPAASADPGANPAANAQAPASSSPSAAPAAAAQPNYRELATKAGLKADQFKTDQELFEAMLAERQQLAPLANVGRQFAPHMTEFQQFLASQQQQQAAAPAQAAADPNEFDLDKHFSEAWGAPAWDKNWDFFVNKGMLVRDDETGLLVPKAGYEAIVAPHVDKINDALAKQSEQHLQLFRGNPVKSMYEKMLPAWKHEMQAMLKEMFGQQQQQTQQQTELQKFEQQYGAQLWDQSGQPTQIGVKLGQVAGRMMDRGIPEHEALALAAEAMGLSSQAPAPAAPAAQPAIAPSPAQATAAKVESFIDQARRNATQQPNSAPYAAPTTNPNQPYVSGEVELANMWTQAAASAAP